MARYKLLIKPSAAIEIEAIPHKKERQRLVRAIQALADNPRPHGCRKLSGKERFRIRTGSWRVIYTIEDGVLIVYVVKVGHRGDVYKGDA